MRWLGKLTHWSDRFPLHAVLALSLHQTFVGSSPSLPLSNLLPPVTSQALLTLLLNVVMLL